MVMAQINVSWCSTPAVWAFMLTNLTSHLLATAAVLVSLQPLDYCNPACASTAGCRTWVYNRVGFYRQYRSSVIHRLYWRGCVNSLKHETLWKNNFANVFASGFDSFPFLNWCGVQSEKQHLLFIRKLQQLPASLKANINRSWMQVRSKWWAKSYEYLLGNFQACYEILISSLIAQRHNSQSLSIISQLSTQNPFRHAFLLINLTASEHAGFSSEYQSWSLFCKGCHGNLNSLDLLTFMYRFQHNMKSQ